MDDLLCVILVLVGLFYAAASVFALRAVAMDNLITNAIAALTASPPERSHEAERFRNRWIVVSALLVGAGALASLALLAIAPWLFAAAAVASLVYRLVLAPRFVDPIEPPAEGARAKSLIQTTALATAALLGFAASARDLLAAPDEAPLRSLLAAGGFVLLCLYAVRTLRKADLRRPLPTWEDDFIDDLPEPPVVEDDIDPDTVSIILVPSWTQGMVLDAATGEPLDHRAKEALLREDEIVLLQRWADVFVEVADPADPRQAAMKVPDGLARLEAAGRPAFERIAARLGAGRVAFEPAPRPRHPRIEASAVKVMADYGCDGLWFHEEERVGPIDIDQFGISRSLHRRLSEWCMDLDASIDMDDPGGPSRWTAAEAAAHASRGRHLALDLARELAATGRAHVRVVYRSPGGEDEEVGAARPASGAAQPVA